MQRAAFQGADAERLAVLEQVLELAAVHRERLAEVEQAGEFRLHLGDSRADGQAPAQFALQEDGRRQVVGVHVGLQQPFHLQVVLANVGDQAFGAGMAGAPGGRVVVEHRVDDGAGAAGRVAHHVAVGGGGRVEEGSDVGFQHGGSLRGVLTATAPWLRIVPP